MTYSTDTNDIQAQKLKLFSILTGSVGKIPYLKIVLQTTLEVIKLDYLYKKISSLYFLQHEILWERFKFKIDTKHVQTNFITLYAQLRNL